MTGLPDSPLRLMRKGRINHAPDGSNISVIMGTNQDEGSLFVLFAPLIARDATLPMMEPQLRAAITHMVSYHDGWNASTVEAVLRAYPTEDYYYSEVCVCVCVCV
jgi:hypothetical protein